MRTGLDAFADWCDGLLRAGIRAQEWRRLENLARQGEAYAERMAFFEREINHLRRLLSLAPTPGRGRVAASIVGYYPLESRITIDSGLQAGVRPGMPVVAGDGLVGIVQNASDGMSQVLLVSSPRFTVGALILRNPPPTGLLRGESSSVLNLEFIDLKSSVEVGDQVVTSGYSSRIPAGIPIGRIVQIEDDVEYGARRCQVFPSVQIGSIREVFVLK
jgi:rod shape-determining protein MreC